MVSSKWNDSIRLTWMDRLLEKTVLQVLPARLTPNHLTVLRILLTPPVVILLAMDRYEMGIALFLFAGATDAIDGALARTRKQITEWGILFDPIADKLLIGSVLFLVVLRNINYALGIALLIVETILIIGGWIRKSRGIIEPANIWGKLKMGAEVLGVLLLLLAAASGHKLFIDLSNGTLVAALITAIISIFAKML